MKLKSNITKKASLIFFALFITSILINAQSNFRPGYIITNEIDTISGLIDFRTYKMNAHTCKFKTSDASAEKVYSPGDIYGYRFTDDGKYYVTKDVEIDGQQKKVFLEYLIQGLISLYFYPTEGFDYYFFQDESGRMIPVTKQQSKMILDDKSGECRFSEDNRYKGKIGYIFRDSESVSKAANKMDFSQSDMISLTKKYHAEMCTTGEACIEFETKSGKYTEIKISVYAGMQIQTYKPRSQFYSEYYGISHFFISDVSSLSPEIGAQVNFSVPRWNKSISLQADVSLAQFSGEEELRSEAQNGQLKINGLIASGRLGVKYTYHKGLIRPMIEGGFQINRLFVSSNYRYFSGILYVREIVKDDFLISPNKMLGFYAGTGLDYQLKKNNALLFRIVYNDCRRLPNNGWPAGTDKMTSWQFKLGYTF